MSYFRSCRQPVHEQPEWLLLPFPDQPGLRSTRIWHWGAFTKWQCVQRPQYQLSNQSSALPAALSNVLQPLHHQRYHQTRLCPITPPQRAHTTFLPRHPRLWDGDAAEGPRSGRGDGFVSRPPAEPFHEELEHWKLVRLQQTGSSRLQPARDQRGARWDNPTPPLPFPFGLELPQPLPLPLPDWEKACSGSCECPRTH